MTTTTHFRQTSLFLKTFGWKTNDVTESIDLSKDIDPSFLAFVNALHVLENVEIKIAKDLKDMLDRFFSTSDSMDLLRADDTRNRQRSKAIAIVFAYKLLDTQRWISGEDISATFTRSTGKAYEEDKYKLWTSKMDNWVALIHTAEAYLKDINVTTTLAPTMNLHKTASLANQLCAHSHKSYGEKIIVNIISFALHVSYIITTGRQDIPSIDLILKDLQETGELHEVTKKTFGTFIETNLRNSLYLALGISPLVLLVPVQWMKKSISPLLILEWWQIMGCHEPLSVRKAEYEMWRLLFDIVSDPRDVVAKILNFLCTVQKPDISDDDAKWFSEDSIRSFVRNKNLLSRENTSNVEQRAVQDSNATGNTPRNTANNTDGTTSSRPNATGNTPRNTNDTDGTPGSGPDATGDTPGNAANDTDGTTDSRPNAPGSTNNNENTTRSTTDNPRNATDNAASDADNIASRVKALQRHSKTQPSPLRETSPTRSLEQSRPNTPHTENKDGNDGEEGEGSRGGLNGSTHRSPSARPQRTSTKPRKPVTQNQSQPTLNQSNSNSGAADSATTAATKTTPAKSKKRSHTTQTQQSTIEEEVDAFDGEDQEILSQVCIVGAMGTGVVGEFHERQLHTHGRLEATLDSRMKRPRRFGGKVLSLYDVKGNKFDWTPNFHGSTENELLLELIDKCHQPLREPYATANSDGLLQDSNSIFVTCTKADFNKMSTDTAQNLFKTRHIILTDTKATTPAKVPWKFNRASLKKIGDWDKPIAIQDQSIQCTDDFGAASVIGKLEDLYYCATTSGAKILNGLDFHPEQVIDPPPQLATDVEAFRRTQGMPFCLKPYPRYNMRWGLAATKDARHFWHIDSDGFASYFIPQCGKKIIFLGKSLDWATKRSHHTFADSNVFGEIDLTKVNSDFWDVEYVILDDDVEFYMRPNSPHVVYTIEASICLGGHFNASFTIQDMCFGMFQTFVTGSSITNASLFAASRDIFIRMAILFGHAIVEERDKKADDIDEDEDSHIIDVTTINGAMDLFTFSNLVELLSVLDVSLCDFEIPLLDREALIYARKTMRIVLMFFFNKYTIEESGETLDKPEINVYLRYLVRHITTLHATLVKRGADDPNVPSSVRFRQDVETAFKNFPTFWRMWNDEGTWNAHKSTVSSSFLWEDADNWSVVERLDNNIQEEDLEMWWELISGLDGFDLNYYRALQRQLRRAVDNCSTTPIPLFAKQ